jgi:uncharacterized membrane protein (DUF485 family)
METLESKKEKDGTVEPLQSKTSVAKDQEEKAVTAHNTRVGVILFVVYVVFYGGFMALSAFSPETMSEPFLGGVNLAVVYGFALIIVPLALGFIYMKLCRKPGSRRL